MTSSVHLGPAGRGGYDQPRPCGRRAAPRAAARPRPRRRGGGDRHRTSRRSACSTRSGSVRRTGSSSRPRPAGWASCSSSTCGRSVPRASASPGRCRPRCGSPTRRGPRTRSTTSIPRRSQQVRDAVGPATVLLDGVGGDVAEAAAELLAPGGRVLSFGSVLRTPRPPGPSHVVVDMPLGPKLLSRPGGLRSLEEEALAAAADRDPRPGRGLALPVGGRCPRAPRPRAAAHLRKGRPGARRD